MIKFGTSGFRAIIGDGFTKENVQRIGYGVAMYAKSIKIKKPTVCVGYDNRFMSETFTKWLIEALAEYCEVKFFVNPVSTPVISFESKSCDFGLMVTSSHNQYYYNGIKIFMRGAFECNDEQASKIAKYANNANLEDIKTIEFNTALENGKIQKTLDYTSYLNSIYSCIDVGKLKKSKLRVLVNTLHGSSIEILKKMCEDLELKKVDFMKSERDVFFENISPAPDKHIILDQAEIIKQGNYDLGLAVDADGDRFSLIDKDGEVYDCEFFAPVLYDYLLSKKGERGAFVKNHALTALADKIAQKYEQKCISSKAGFKNIGDFFKVQDCLIGAESNGISYSPHISCKDGIMACALCLEMITSTEKSFGELLSEVKNKYNFESYCDKQAYNISLEQKEQIIKKLFEDKQRPKFKGLKIVSENAEEDLKLYFEDDYWCVVRFSGIESMIRISAELPTQESLDMVMDEMRSFLNLK